MTLRVPLAVAERVRKACETAYPEEGCGLLIGPLPKAFNRPDREVRVAEARPLANGWESPNRGRRYELDPKALASAERELEGSGSAVVGFYHSHPDVPAWPSPFDLERAWPCYSYWIVSVRGAKADGGRSWVRSEDGASFVEEKLVVEEE